MDVMAVIVADGVIIDGKKVFAEDIAINLVEDKVWESEEISFWEEDMG